MAAAAAGMRSLSQPCQSVKEGNMESTAAKPPTLPDPAKGTVASRSSVSVRVVACVRVSATQLEVCVQPSPPAGATP